MDSKRRWLGGCSASRLVLPDTIGGRDPSITSANPVKDGAMKTTRRVISMTLPGAALAGVILLLIGAWSPEAFGHLWPSFAASIAVRTAYLIPDIHQGLGA